VDSLAFSGSGTRCSKDLYTVPTGQWFVLTDFATNYSVGNSPLVVVDNGTVPRWGVSGVAATGTTGSSSYAASWHSLVFPPGHTISIMAVPNGLNTVTYYWAGYLVPVGTASVQAAPREQLGFKLYPNPSRQQVTLRFELRRASKVSLAIYDIQGRRVRMLQNGLAAAGAHVVAWDGRDDEGIAASPGAYVARVMSNGAGSVRKLVRVN